MEKDKPLFPDDFDNWFKRKLIYPSTSLGNYNWRKVQNNDPIVIEQFKNIILSDKNNLIYDIVNFKEVKMLLNNNIKAAHMRFIWSLASLIVFINELSSKKSRSFSEKITLKLPSTSVSEFKSKKELIDITNSFIPTNKFVSNVKNQYTINNFDANRVLKSFPGKVNEPPKEISLTTQKTLKIRVCLKSDNNLENVSL